MAQDPQQDNRNDGKPDPANPNTGKSNLEWVADLLAGTDNDTDPDVLSRRARMEIQRQEDMRIFFRAIRRGHAETIRAMLAGKFPPNMPDNNGTRPLHAAAREGNIDIMRLLLAAGANPYLPKAAAGDNIFKSIGRGIADIFNDNTPPPVDPPDDAAADPVKLAAARQRARQTPVTEAIRYKRADIMIALAEYEDTTKTPEGWHALHHACDMGQTDMLDALLQRGFDPNCRNGNGSTPLLVAIHRERWDCVRRLLQDPRAATALDTAVTDTDPLKRPALLCLMDGASPDIIAAALAAGCNPNIVDANGYTPLHYAIETGDVATVALLLQAGADPDKTAPHVAAPLLYLFDSAPPRTRVPIMMLLLRAGSNIDARDPDTGETVLFDILATQDDALLQDFLRYAPDVNVLNRYGTTALQQVQEDACTRQNRNRQAAGRHGRDIPDAFAQLLGAGADPDMQDHHGRTALHHAVTGDAQDDNLVAVKKLLSHGASPLICDYTHKSPLYYARENRRHPDGAAVIAALEGHLAATYPDYAPLPIAQQNAKSGKKNEIPPFKPPVSGS